MRPLEMPPEGSGISRQFGFRDGDRGAHSARTMMLDELSHLLDAVPAGSQPQAYEQACLEANVLGKSTMANRKNSLRNLIHLYALDESVPLFRILRALWQDRPSRPLLALLISLARDPLLRLSAPAVFSLSEGDAADRDIYAPALESLGDRFTPASQKSIAQNFASTWTHAGHVRGFRVKLRARAVATPRAAACAATIAFLAGLRGVSMMESTWLTTLDVPASQAQSLLTSAAQAGLVDFKCSGSVVSLIPRGLLTPPEIALADQLAHSWSPA